MVCYLEATGAHLPLSWQPVLCFELCFVLAAFENAEVLLGVDVDRLLAPLLMHVSLLNKPRRSPPTSFMGGGSAEKNKKNK